MHPTQVQIAGFLNCMKTCQRYLRQDKQALLKLRNKQVVYIGLEHKFREYFNFYKEYKHERQLKAKELNKRLDRYATNSILQEDDRLFYRGLTEDQIRRIITLSAAQPIAFYCTEIRSAIPPDVLSQVDAIVEEVPKPPASYFEYYIRKIAEQINGAQ